jgi:hypothetical protein
MIPFDRPALRRRSPDGIRGYLDGLRAAAQLVAGSANYQDSCERIDLAIQALESQRLTREELDLLDRHAQDDADENGDVSVDAGVLLELVRIARKTR